MSRPDQRLPRVAAALPGVLLSAVLLVACAAPGGSGSPAAAGSPSVELSPNASTANGAPVSLRIVVPPAPGPVKPFRGEMVEQVYLADGLISMFFQLRNVGQEPVTFLNTLYDYEPTQLYTPAVRLEWKEGGNAVYTRAGRFFPSPAIVQVGQSAIYLMAGQPISGVGTPGDLVTHIKYCPTRGMNDVPAVPLKVSGLHWSAGADGVTVQGTITETQGERRNKAPTIGVAFFDASDRFIGAVLGVSSGAPVGAHASRSFELSGGGVATSAIASAQGFAYIP